MRNEPLITPSNGWKPAVHSTCLCFWLRYCLYIWDFKEVKMGRYISEKFQTSGECRGKLFTCSNPIIPLLRWSWKTGGLSLGAESCWADVSLCSVLCLKKHDGVYVFSDCPGYSPIPEGGREGWCWWRVSSLSPETPENIHLCYVPVISIVSAYKIFVFSLWRVD